MSPAEGVGDGLIEFHIILSPSPPPPTSPPPLPPPLPPHILILGGSDQQPVVLLPYFYTLDWGSHSKLSCQLPR